MLLLNRIGDSMKKRYIFMIVIFAVTIVMMGSSFAYLKSIEESSVNASINIAQFNVELVQDVVSVTMNNLVPMRDTDGVNNTPTTFAIQNTGGVDASYRVTLVDGEHQSGVTYMKNSDVRYQLTKTIGTGTPQVLGPYTLPDSGIIDEGTILAGTNNDGQTISYELVMWVDYNSNPNGQSFSKYVVVDGMQVASLDTSGANYPELSNNMIPVYYDSTNSVWKKADSKNLDSNYQWFDYNNKIWANAVTVLENGTTSRSDYLAAANGTTIADADITSMWVWIPRYKYIVFNGNNETANEQTINVTFEHGRDSTGTVTCSSTTAGVETCDTITNKVSTYTHPAFTFGSDELTGIWVSKYEMSTDDANCSATPNTSNCNKNTLNIVVKPNATSLKYINVFNMFANIRKMELVGNIHGFVQGETATTFTNTGVITNDSNTIDTHMIKNSEWGAVAYLSHSKYGNPGNAADSTTGNEYGVYNLNNGSSEYVMANMVNSSGNFQVSSASTWSTSTKPEAMYYDIYSYSADATGETSLIRGKLGDGTKEVTTDFTSATGRWYSGANNLMSGSNSWGLRNGIYGLSNSSTGTTDSSITTRPTLVILRNMPWLNNN